MWFQRSEFAFINTYQPETVNLNFAGETKSYVYDQNIHDHFKKDKSQKNYLKEFILVSLWERFQTVH